MGIWTFFGLTSCLSETLKSLCVLVHKEFKFPRVFGLLSLQVTNVPGMANVLGLNVNKNLFFRT